VPAKSRVEVAVAGVNTELLGFNLLIGVYSSLAPSGLGVASNSMFVLKLGSPLLLLPPAFVIALEPI
jgi:hypothetical protein